MSETTYTNKQGVTIKHGDKVRVLSEIIRGDGRTIEPGTLATAEYHEATNREPFWVLNVGGEWNPMESHSDLVAMFEVVELADSAPVVSCSVSDDLMSPFKSILAWHKKQKDLSNIAKREINKVNASIIKNGKTDLQQILSLLGISVLTTDMKEGKFTVNDDDISLDVYEVFVSVNGYEFSIRTDYGDDCKLNPFLNDNNVSFFITKDAREKGKDIGLVVKFTTIIGFAYPDHVFSFVYKYLFDDIPF